MSIRILVVEDDPQLLPVLLECADIGGYEARGVSSAEDALDLMRREQFGVLITDINLPGMTGLELLRHCPELNPGIVPVVITAYGTVEKAVEAMKRGASDFIQKPFEADTLLSALEVAAKRATRAPRRGPAEAVALPAGVIAESDAMRRVFEEAAAFAPYNTTVLVTGATGTGKEVIARSIHSLSPRAGRPFVALNCAAVPEQLLEDELFGHVKGAFTGAQAARDGRFEQADGGTLFLDEIGDMSLPLQSKLLRVLQEREFEKLGSSRKVRVDVRVVAATSADLELGIREKTFREDLFYRLNVERLRLPPLCERRDDIHPLAQHLLAKFNEDAGLPVKTLSDEAVSALLAYHWPGNVRQLQNAMERAAIISRARPLIVLADLPEEVRGGPPGVTPALAVRDEAREAAGAAESPDGRVNFNAVVSKVERDLLLKSLAKANGNKVRAAEWLGMKRTTFAEKLKRLNLDEGGDDGE